MTNANAATAAPVTGNRWAKLFPILGWLPAYKPAWFSKDLMAGLIIVCLLVPEGMAYAQIAGMPPQTVFYVAPPALLLYAIFASSNKLVVVVSATQAALSAATIGALASPGSTQWMELTAALALLAGVITFAAGILRLGVIAQFFSPSVLVGFVSGLALVIAIKQVPKILGIEGGEGDFWERLWDILRNLGATNTATLLVGAIAIGVMVGVERFAKRLPAALIALIIGIAMSRILGLEAMGVEVVQEIPSGLVGPQIPDVSLNDLYFLAAAAFGIFLVNFAEANSVASEFARRDGRKLDSNKELEGLGAANVGAGLFQGFAVGASLSKSAAADEAGMHTQMAGIIAAVGAILVALFLTGLFTGLPEATLGGIVIVAVSGMIKIPRIRQLWTLRKTDFMLALLALLAVLSFETLPALVFAVGLSIVILVIQAADAPVTRLGQQADGRYVALTSHPDAQQDPSTVVVRLDAEMFFANSDAVIDQIFETATDQEPKAQAVVLDLEATYDIDVPACDALETLAKQLKSADVRFALARVHPKVAELLGKTGAVEVIGRNNLFEDVDQAVRAVEAAESPEKGRWMEGSFAWGSLAASSLVIGALVTFYVRIPLRVIGLIMGFGGGVLISAVAFDLVAEAAEMSIGTGWTVAGLFAGALVFFLGDRAIDRLGAGDRKDPTGVDEGGSSLSIVLGTVLDGIPESLVIGLTIFSGGAVGIAYLAAVFISNLPESISSSSGLLTGGWTKSRVLWMWIGIAVVSGLASLLGYVLFQNSSPDVVAFVLAFAAGAILTMLANTMMPEAFEHGGKLVGIMVVLGFAIAFTIHLLG